MTARVCHCTSASFDLTGHRMGESPEKRGGIATFIAEHSLTVASTTDSSFSIAHPDAIGCVLVCFSDIFAISVLVYLVGLKMRFISLPILAHNVDYLVRTSQYLDPQLQPNAADLSQSRACDIVFC